MAEAKSNSLTGKRIVITRAAAQSEELARELSSRGAIPIVLPLVSFAEAEDLGPLDEAIAGIERFEWMIVTSAQAVRALARRSRELKQSLAPPGSQVRIAAVGPVSAEAARQAGLAVELIAEEHNGLALANELGNRVQGKRVLLPRSDRANPDLPVALRRHGAMITELIAYRTVRPSEMDQRKLKEIGSGDADGVLFFSPSAVQNFVELVGNDSLRGLQDKLAITAVGPVTAKALREAGVLRMVVAEETTAGSVVRALEEYFAGAVRQASAGAKRE